MAKQSNNVVTHGLSGKVGDLLVFRQRAGKTVVAKRPTVKKKSTEEQKRHQRRFQQAIIYGKTAIADPDMKAAYTDAAKPGQTAFNVAVADFFNAPSIENVDLNGYKGRKGDTITVLVKDDFLVKEVKIRISNADGSIVEEDDAQSDNIGYRWTYTATQDNESLDGDRIEIMVSDIPGNITQEEREL